MTRRITGTDIARAQGFTSYDGAANPAGFVTPAGLAGYATTSSVTALLSGLGAGGQTAAQVAAAIAAGTAADVSGVVAIAHGGTGATTAAAARANLDLAPVASSGNYADLSGTPTLPADVAQLANSLGYQTAAQLADAVARAVADAIPGGTALLAGSGNAGRAVTLPVGDGLSLAGGVLAPVVGTAPGSLAAGDDARLVGAAQAAALAAVAFSGNYADLVGQAPAGDGTGFVLEPATSDRLGGVKVGAGLAAPGGVLAVAFGSTPGTAAAGDDPRILAAQTAQQVGGAIAGQLAPYATTSDVAALVAGRIADLVGAAPGTLDTVAELAAQLQADEGGAATLAALVATKQDAAQVAAAIAAGTAASISGTLAIAQGGTGATDAPAARAALGLGLAATRGVGTNATSVAAGNDARFAQAAQRAANLSDLANVITARGNLGLTAAATAAIGTTPGTLAAGDDARLAGAAQRAANLSDLADPAAARANLGLAALASSGRYADLADAPAIPATQAPYPAASVPALADLRLLLADGSTITGSQLQSLLGAAPGGGTPAPAYALTLATPAAQVAGAAFAVSGAYANGTPAALEVSTDAGATWSAGNATIGGGSFSFNVTIAAANASQTVSVRDSASPGVTASTGAFVVAAAGGGGQAGGASSKYAVTRDTSTYGTFPTAAPFNGNPSTSFGGIVHIRASDGSTPTNVKGVFTRSNSVVPTAGDPPSGTQYNPNQAHDFEFLDADTRFGGDAWGSPIWVFKKGSPPTGDYYFWVYWTDASGSGWAVLPDAIVMSA